MLRLLPIGMLLAACSAGGGPPPSSGDLAAEAGALAPAGDAQETIAPGAEGLYQGDPLAGPDLDGTADPL